MQTGKKLILRYLDFVLPFSPILPARNALVTPQALPA